MAEPLKPEELSAWLVAHSDRLRGSIKRGIPARYQSTISADDILQEVWVAAHQGLAGFRVTDSTSIDRWLQVIAKNKLIDALKHVRTAKRGRDQVIERNAHQQHSSLDDLMARLVGSIRTPSSEAAIREARNQIGVALASLPKDQREVVRMRYEDGMDRPDIASHLGKTEAAVGSLLFRGLRGLKRSLGSANKYYSDARTSLDENRHTE